MRTSSPMCARRSKPRKLTVTYRRSSKSTGQCGFQVRPIRERIRGPIRWTDDTNRSDSGGGNRSTVGSCRTRSGAGVGSTRPKPSGRVGSGLASTAQTPRSGHPALAGGPADRVRARFVRNSRRSGSAPDRESPKGDRSESLTAFHRTPQPGACLRRALARDLPAGQHHFRVTPTAHAQPTRPVGVAHNPVPRPQPTRELPRPCPDHGSNPGWCASAVRSSGVRAPVRGRGRDLRGCADPRRIRVRTSTPRRRWWRSGGGCTCPLRGSTPSGAGHAVLGDPHPALTRWPTLPDCYGMTAKARLRSSSGRVATRRPALRHALNPVVGRRRRRQAVPPGTTRSSRSRRAKSSTRTANVHSPIVMTFAGPSNAYPPKGSQARNGAK